MSGPKPRPLLDRIVERLEVADCWQDTGRVDEDGRCRIQWTDAKGKRHGQPTYRALYQLLVGPLEGDKHLHHWCLNITCCNPDHLHPCSQAENNSYDSWKVPPNGASNRIKTHCVNGHEFTPENTYVYPTRRTCKTCLRASKARRKGER